MKLNFNEVVENSEKHSKFQFRFRIILLFGEMHISQNTLMVEPFMNLTFMNGEEKVYKSVDRIVDSNDLKSTHFNLGVNFSLFF